MARNAIITYYRPTHGMHISRKFGQRGSNFDNVFSVDERREDPNTTISGPPSVRQRNAI